MTAKILVTGGAGFIGSEIVKQLSAHDEYEIRVLDALTKQIHGNNPEKSYLFQSIKRLLWFHPWRRAWFHNSPESPWRGRCCFASCGRNRYRAIHVHDQPVQRGQCHGFVKYFSSTIAQGGKQHYTQSHPVVIAFCVWRRRVSMPKLWRSLPPWTQN